MRRIWLAGFLLLAAACGPASQDQSADTDAEDMSAYPDGMAVDAIGAAFAEGEAAPAAEAESAPAAEGPMSPSPDISPEEYRIRQLEARVQELEGAQVSSRPETRYTKTWTYEDAEGKRQTFQSEAACVVSQERANERHRSRCRNAESFGSFLWRSCLSNVGSCE